MAEGEGNTVLAGATTAAATTETTAETKPTTAATAETKPEAATTEAKPAEGTKPEEKKDDKPTGAPEKYEDFKFAEGVAPDAEAIKEFQGVAKELNLTQDQAQKLVELQGKYANLGVQKLQEGWQNTLKTWAEEAKADPEIGGAKWNDSLVLAKKGIAAFGDAKFEEMFEQTGVGNNPAFLRFMVKLGRAVSDDKVHLGGVGAKEENPLKAMYPTMFK